VVPQPLWHQEWRHKRLIGGWRLGSRLAFLLLPLPARLLLAARPLLLCLLSFSRLHIGIVIPNRSITPAGAPLVSLFSSFVLIAAAVATAVVKRHSCVARRRQRRRRQRALVRRSSLLCIAIQRLIAAVVGCGGVVHAARGRQQAAGMEQLTLTSRVKVPVGAKLSQ
jgi:hypothetical protein